MFVKPNKTVIRGIIKSARPHPDGSGREIELNVHENRSSPDSDFIQPTPGSLLKLYSAKAPKIVSGDFVEVEATLVAGPFGERVVSQNIRKLKQP